jgi:hypothetical protein
VRCSLDLDRDRLKAELVEPGMNCGEHFLGKIIVACSRDRQTAVTSFGHAMSEA